MKYCVFCGKKINDDNLFCPYCGNKQPELKEISEQNEVISEKKKESKTSLVLGILSIIFTLSLGLSFIGAILGMIGLLKSKNGEYKTLNAIGIIVFIVEALIGLIITIILLCLYA